MTGDQHFALLSQHIPYDAQGFQGWMTAVSVLSAVTADWLGLGGCLAIVITLALLQAFNRRFLYRESHPIKSAFFMSYWGVPEAYVMCSTLAMQFVLHIHGTRATVEPFWRFETVTAAVVSPFLQMLVKMNDASNIPGIRQRLPRSLLAAILSLLVLYLASFLRAGVPSFAPISLTSCFTMAWSPMLGCGLALDWPGHGGFYKWYSQCGMSMARKRGLGFSDYLPYGFIPMPNLSNTSCMFLSIFLSIVAPLAGVLATSSTVLVPTIMLCVLLPGFMVYASQFGQESSIGEHHSIPVFAALVYIGLGWGTQWATAMLKVHMISLYFSAGLLKLVTSLITGKAWWGASTMQYFIFSALFSRPTKAGGWRDTLCRFIIKTPFLCVFLAISGIVFELASPVALFYPAASVMIAFVALMFHLGIFVMQGISFLSYWCPVLVVFIIDSAPLTQTALMPETNASLMQQCCWTLAALHLAAQCFFAMTFHEAWALPSPLPFSCMPVFAIPSNIFEQDVPASWAMIGGNVNSTGHMGPLEWLGPQFQDPWYRLSEEDVHALPFPVVWICVGKPMAKDAESLSKEKRRATKGPMKYIRTIPLYDAFEHQFFNLYHGKVRESGFAVFSNFPLPKDLEIELASLCRFILSGRATHCTDPTMLQELLDRQSTCVNIFEKIVSSQGVPSAPESRFQERGVAMLGTWNTHGENEEKKTSKQKKTHLLNGTHKRE